MNLVINLENTVLDTEGKYNEINNFIVEHIVDALEEKKVNRDLILNQLVNYYKVYEEEFGKSIHTYIMSVLSTVSFHSGYCYFEHEGYALGFLESFIDNISQFKNYFKGDYGYRDYGLSFIKTVDHKFDNIIAYGKSNDEICEYEINQVVDDIEDLIFDEHYIVPETDEVTMESIFLNECIDPQDTFVITGDLLEANIAHQLGAEAVYVKSSNWYEDVDNTYINYGAADFTVVENLAELDQNDIIKWMG